MKIILLEDVKTLGKKGDTVEVNEGYARNFILPKKLGLEANAKNMNDLRLQKANEQKKAQELYESALEYAKEIEKVQVAVKMKVGDNGKTFGAISSKEIAKAAMEQHKMELDKKKMQIPDAIKSLGVYEVGIRLHPKVTATLKVKVEQEL